MEQSHCIPRIRGPTSRQARVSAAMLSDLEDRPAVVVSSALVAEGGVGGPVVESSETTSSTSSLSTTATALWSSSCSSSSRPRFVRSEMAFLKAEIISKEGCRVCCSRIDRRKTGENSTDGKAKTSHLPTLPWQVQRQRDSPCPVESTYCVNFQVGDWTASPASTIFPCLPIPSRDPVSCQAVWGRRQLSLCLATSL